MRQKVILFSALWPSAETNMEAVVKHNTPESCWVILYGKVYDVRPPNRSHHDRSVYQAKVLIIPQLGDRLPLQSSWWGKDHS